MQGFKRVETVSNCKIYRLFKFYLVFILIVLSVQTANAGQSNGEEPPEKSLAYCLLLNIPKLDDGKSDASSIARALVHECRKEFEAMFKISPDIARGMAPEDVRKLEADTDYDNLNSTTNFVLKYRIMMKELETKKQ